MSNFPLISTSIVDKNGKQTTVRKRAVSNQNSTSASAIAKVKPAALPKPMHLDRLSDDPSSLEYALKTEFSIKARRLSNKRIGEMLDALQPDTMSKIESLWGADHNDFVVQQVIFESSKRGSVAPLNNLALFYTDEPRKTYQSREFHSYVYGLANLSEFEDDEDFSKAPEALQKSMKAVLKVTLDADGRNRRSMEIGSSIWTYLTSEPLVRLIIERPDDADRIISIINGRPEVQFYREDQVDHLREMLYQNVISALDEGTL